MQKDDKIISFRKRSKRSFELKATISIHVKRHNEEHAVSWESPNKELSQEQLYVIQTKILSNLINTVDFIRYKKVDTYDVEFTLLYFEKSRRKFKYICIPQNIKKENLVEYLMVSINMYELKKNSIL